MITTVEKAVKITMAFEGSRGFSNIGANFDGQGMSFGALQWNAGKGTLQPLLRDAIKAIGFEKAQEIFTNDGLYLLNKRLENNTDFFKWTCTLSQVIDGKLKVIEPWYTRFYKLGLTPECQQVQIRHMDRYIKTANGIVQSYGFKSDRAWALAFDIAVQNGSVVPDAKEEYAAKVKPGLNEKSKLLLLANAVANASNKQWIEDVRARKVAIVTGAGIIHKKPYHLDRDYGLTDTVAILGEFA